MIWNIKKGKLNKVADMLSRLPIEDSIESSTPADYINLVDSFDFNEITFSKIKSATRSDIELQAVMDNVRFGWHSEDPKIKNVVRDKMLSICDEVLLWNNRLVILKELKEEMLRALHSGHAGIEEPQKRR